MKKIRAALVRLVGILHLTRSDREIDEELRSHLNMLADQYRHAGFSDADAQRAAAAKFGSLASVAEAYRDRRSIPVVEQLVADCRYAARSVNHTRVLSSSMILVLALGIGVTTTLVTLFHAVAFRTLPLPEPDRVVKLSLGFSGDVNRRVNGHVSQFSYPELTLYKSARVRSPESPDFATKAPRGSTAATDAASRSHSSRPTISRCCRYGRRRDACWRAPIVCSPLR
jgi:hypothetical protein